MKIYRNSSKTLIFMQMINIVVLSLNFALYIVCEIFLSKNMRTITVSSHLKASLIFIMSAFFNSKIFYSLQVIASHFEGLLTTLIGYVIIAFSLIILYVICSIVRLKKYVYWSFQGGRE